MTVSSIRVKIVRKPTLKLKVLPKFPGNVTAASPILLDRTGGNFTFNFDVNALQTTLNAFYAPALFTQIGTGAVSRAVTDKLTDVVNVLDFVPSALIGGVRNGSNATDLAPYLAAAWAAVTARNPMPALVFPGGVYLASAFPNFAVSKAVVIADGEVRLRYTGTSHAVFLDGGSSLPGINNVTFGGANPFIIECPKTGQDGCRIRNVHRSRINVNVRGAGWTAGVPAFAGIRALGCVCTKFDAPTVSSNVEAVAWYDNAKPLHGMLLDERAVGAQTSYCTIVNPAMEGTTYGVYHASALGNVILGGTAESCSDTGLYYDTNSTNNRAIGCDMEANGVRDVLLAGTRNALIECDTADIISVSGNASRPRIDGGVHHQITVIAGVNNAQLGSFGFNRKATTGAITDGGTNTQIRDAINLGTAAYTGKVLRADLNLSDLATAATARTNLGLVAVASSGSASDLTSGTLAAARGGAGTITGALKGSGAGVVSQAAVADLSDTGTGTWTPVLAAASGGPATYTVQSGSYEKIGRLVIARFNIVTSGLGALSGSIKLTGLPFTSANTANDKGTCSMASWGGFTLDPNYTTVGGVILPNTSEILIMENGGAGVASFQLVGASIAAATTIIGTCMYHV